MMRMFHCNNNENHVARGNPGFDPLFKIRPIVDRLTAAFTVAYKPKQHITIDEGMSPWRGNLSFKINFFAKRSKDNTVQTLFKLI